ncbi:hypothetical protein MYX76_16640 [Desulfobacterota bacterium AH_259_B03_O07]|nr:hypothetical protein [Desulfobacterota bacterium AH_259_B03_O07]
MNHLIVRDTYNYKLFEIIQEDGFIFIYDYTLKRFLKGFERLRWLEEENMNTEGLNKSHTIGGVFAVGFATTRQVETDG